MKTKRRIDPKKVNEIQDLIKKCKDALLSEENTIFTEYKAIPNATRLEHAAANYPLNVMTNNKTKKKTIDADILKKYNEEIRLFNKSMKDLDMEIIGVPYEFQDVNGNHFKMCFRVLAEGINAKKAAEQSRARSKGELEKEKRLIEMSNNPELKKSHDAKMRAIRRLLDRSGKKRG